MLDQQIIKAVLQWHLDTGVDETIADEPQDRFAQFAAEQAQKAAPAAGARAQAAPPPASSPSSAPAARAPVVKPPAPKAPSDQAALADAVQLAHEAGDLDGLRAALEKFDGCALKATASNLCFIDGNQNARLLLVGEAPGAEEDRQGLPFVGPSGQLLDAMLASVGLDRRADDPANAALISNTVFWRPPGNRTPTPRETALCLPFIERLIEIVGPKALVCVGGPSAKSLLGQSRGITRLRGKWFSYETPGMTAPIPAMALYHPAYLLRSPAMKRDAWRDLLMLRRKFDEL
ncbi:MAG: uracil-DNA glycosylase [Rhodospirillaceae bacterium]